MEKHVWVIDDEQAICWSLKRALEKIGYRVTTFSTAEDALKALPSTERLDVVLMDVRLPGMDGFAATTAVKSLRPEVPVVMMTAFGDLSSAMRAMELGVFDYLTKPFELQEAMRTVAKGVQAMTRASVSVGPSEGKESGVLLGSSPVMQRVYKQIAVAAANDVSVLVVGADGTGKETVASTIHHGSLRSEAPFLVFSPVTIAPIAIAAELLGSVQSSNSNGEGPFRSGALELSGDGTLYIDEVSDLPLPLQSQLLRVLEQRQYTRVGDSTARFCSARVIMSTSRNLKALVAEGEFSDKLRQRICLFSVELPPLSERREDIVEIARSLLLEASPKRSLKFSQTALDYLASRPWPGNVRELRNAIERAIIVSGSNWIEAEDLASFAFENGHLRNGMTADLSAEVRRWVGAHLVTLEEQGLRVSGGQMDEMFGTMYDDFLSSVERPFLQAMMEAFHHNRAAIAAQLGMHRSTLRQKMRRYQID